MFHFTLHKNEDAKTIFKASKGVNPEILKQKYCLGIYLSVAITEEKKLNKNKTKTSLHKPTNCVVSNTSSVRGRALSNLT